MGVVRMRSNGVREGVVRMWVKGGCNNHMMTTKNSVGIVGRAWSVCQEKSQNSREGDDYEQGVVHTMSNQCAWVCVCA